MKKLLIAIFCLLSPISFMNAQESAKEARTKLEAFQAKTGTVIIRGFSTIGTLRSPYNGTVTVESKEFTDAISGRKEYGITIEVKEAGRIERENTSYIDYDEIDSLVKGIDYIGKIDNTSTKMKEFQADYRTKGDLMISTFSLNKEVMIAISSGTIGKASTYFKLSSLAEIRDLIINAKAQIDSIKQSSK